MKKTLIASAVAAAALTTNAFAMDPATDLAEKLDSMPTVYGNIQLFHSWSETDNNGTETSEHEFKDGGSTLGIKHESMISEGLTAFLKAEMEFDADDKNSSSGLSGLDEAYVGVKGDFGSVQVGSDDTVYELMVNVLDTSEQIGLGANYSSFDTVNVKATPTNTDDDESNEGDNIQYVGTFDAITVGLTHSIDDTDSTFGTQIGGAFTTDMVTIGASYHMARDASTAAGVVKGQDSIGLSAAATIEDLTILAQFEMLDESESDAKDDADYMGIQGMYTMGQNTFALGYAVESYGFDQAEDEGTLYLQALHSLNDNMYAYIEYSSTSDADGAKGVDKQATAVGVAYSF